MPSPKLKQGEKSTETLFYEGLCLADPDQWDAVRLLADNLTAEGFHEEGLHWDRKLAAHFPFDPSVRYNLACSLSLTGFLPPSMEELKNAFRLGFGDWQWALKDPDLQALRSSTFWKENLAELRVE